jgi:hypothetical protein
MHKKVDMPELKSATVTQITGEGGETPWVVNNSNQEPIYELPKEMNEHHVMAAIHMGRKFEKDAFNKGMIYEKEVVGPRTIDNLQKIVRNLKSENEFLLKENEKIATALDKLIESD